MHFVGLMRRPLEQPVYARLNNDMYLRIGWFAGAEPSTAAFRSECRSRFDRQL